MNYGFQLDYSTRVITTGKHGLTYDMMHRLRAKGIYFPERVTLHHATCRC